MTDNELRGLLNVDGLINDLNRGFSSLISDFDQMQEVSSRRQRERLNRSYNEQSQSLEQQLGMLQQIYNNSGDLFDEIDRQMMQTFLTSRQRDLSLYETAYRRSFRNLNNTTQRFGNSMNSMFDNFQTRVQTLSSVITAINTNKMVSNFTSKTMSSAELLWDIESSLNLTADEMSNLQDKLDSYSEDLLKYNGAVSREDFYGAVDSIIKELGISNTDLAVELGEEFTKAAESLGIDSGTFTGIAEFMSNNKNVDYGYISDTMGVIKGLVSDYNTKADSLMSAFDSQQAYISQISGGDTESARKITDSLLSAVALIDSKGLDSDKFLSILEGIRDGSNLESLAGTGLTPSEALKMINSGDYLGFTESYLNGMGAYASKVNSTLMDKQLQSLWGLSSDDYYKIKSVYSQNSKVFSDLSDNIISDVNGFYSSIDEDLMNNHHGGVVDSTLSSLSLTGFGGDLVNFIEGLDIDSNDISAVGTTILSLLGIRSLFGRRGSSGGVGGALGSSGGISGALGSLGSKAYLGLGTLGESLITAGGGTAAGVSTTGLAVTGGASVLGGAIGGISVIDGIVDVASSQTKETWQERADSLTEGAIQIGGTAASAAVGAAVGSIVPGLGTVVGGLIGAGVGGLATLIWGDDWAQQITDSIDGTDKIKKSLEEGSKSLEGYNKALDNKAVVDSLIDEYYDLSDKISMTSEGTELYTKYNSELEEVIGKINDIYPNFVDLVDDEYSNKKGAIETVKKLTEAELKLNEARLMSSNTDDIEALKAATDQYNKSKEDYDSKLQGVSDVVDYFDIMQRVSEGLSTGELVLEDEKIKQGTMSDKDYQELMGKSWDAGNYAEGMTEFWYKQPFWQYNQDESGALYHAYRRFQGGNGWGDGLKNTLDVDYSTQSEDLENKKNTIDSLIDQKLSKFETVLGDKTYEDIAKNYRNSSSTEKSILNQLGQFAVNVPENFRNKLPDVPNLEKLADFDFTGEGKIGSYRTGLDYVPYDEFPAILHEGEAVLTKDEAGDWRDKALLTGLLSSDDNNFNLITILKDSWCEAFTESQDLMESVNLKVIKRGLQDRERLESANSSTSSSSAVSSSFDTLMSTMRSTLGSVGLPSYDVGISRVPFDQIALVHKDEMIVPASFNPVVSGEKIRNSSVDSELISVVKQGFEAIIRKIGETKSTGVIKSKEFTSDVIFSL